MERLARQVAATCRNLPRHASEAAASCRNLPQLAAKSLDGKLRQLAATCRQAAVLVAPYEVDGKLRQVAATCRRHFDGNLTATCSNLPRHLIPNNNNSKVDLTASCGKLPLPAHGNLRQLAATCLVPAASCDNLQQLAVRIASK